jgi:uncharacterized protein (TIGR03790 family)
MLRTAIVSIFFVSSSFIFGQTGTYKDVAVIINLNSPMSDSVGMYFINERHIPLQNRIYISTSISEEIDSTEFQNLRNQVELYLTINHLTDSINYIVTTKGTPLKVKRSDLMAASSVESELSLILGPYANYIQKSGRIVSPYYRQREHFTHARYGMYIVTRLDGYDFNSIKNIIDQSSHIAQTIPVESRFIFDQDPNWNKTVPSLNRNMTTISSLLSLRGLNVKLDTSAVFLTGEHNVLGYTSWGSNDAKPSFHGLVNNTWMRGAIAETYVSTSGRTFTAPAVYGQSLIADLISEGVTAAKGYVYEPYSSAMADVSVLFDLYTNGYTVSESFYSASPYLSWMDVIVGDPKFRLISSRLPADFVEEETQSGTNTLPVELVSFNSIVKNNVITVQWKTATEINNAGFEVERRSISNRSEWNKVGFIQGSGTSNVSIEYSFTDKIMATGKYEYRLKQIDQDGKIEYSTTIIALVSSADNASLTQNYPNPFNPQTEISFRLPASSKANLTVYDVAGKEIAILVNGELAAGDHSVQFNAQSLSSGVYFYTLQTGNYSESKKMILMK